MKARECKKGSKKPWALAPREGAPGAPDAERSKEQPHLREIKVESYRHGKRGSRKMHRACSRREQSCSIEEREANKLLDMAGKQKDA